ncbi:hypothetical protein B0H66DRAFT_49298 [Apodospora peruviana]|uniref:Uncharacterized protein n=1 Tax=Apodospora peruviana TaxID=516989 RepID=A0AAE0IRY7_9PEZI|nr:hypothetical protein B0H66DRAFT_49298 [Apodospora peruviana]
MANILVSNGTCYTAAGKKLDKSFIPCGNAAFGHQTCCGAGDNCLKDNACFGVHGSGYGSFLTYMAGCTDPDYKDKSCPDKEGIDQPWIALTLCNEGRKDGFGVWAACSQVGNPSTLQPGSYCSCSETAKATVAFTDGDVIASTASLPQATGQSIQFFVGYVPSGTVTEPAAPPPPGASTTGPSPGTSSGGNINTPTQGTTGPTPTTSGADQPSNTSSGGSSPSQTGGDSGNSSSPPGSDPSNDNTGESSSGASSGLSPGAKAGIGVGAAVAVLIFLAVMVALFLSHRRKLAARRRSSAAAAAAESEKGEAKSSAKHHSNTPSEADGQPARPWSMRSELEGSQVPQAAGMEGVIAGAGAAGRRSKEDEVIGDGLSPIAELPGSEPQKDQDGRRRVVVGNGTVYL